VKVSGPVVGLWCVCVVRSKIDPIKSVAKTMRGIRELLLNWFRADGELSSGVVEEFNNNVKLVTRKLDDF